MALNFPGTYEVRLFYQTNETTGINEHELRLSCEMATAADPGDPFSAWFPIQKGGSSATALDSHVDDLITDLQPLFHTTTDFILAELWEYDPGTFDAIFRSAYTIGANGTSATATNAMSQTVWTFRSQLGGIMKVDLRGTIFAVAISQSFPTATTAVNTLAAEITATDSIWVARDGGYAVAPIRWLPGQNERAFKKVFRPS